MTRERSDHAGTSRWDSGKVVVTVRQGGREQLWEMTPPPSTAMQVLANHYRRLVELGAIKPPVTISHGGARKVVR